MDPICHSAQDQKENQIYYYENHRTVFFVWPMGKYNNEMGYEALKNYNVAYLSKYLISDQTNVLVYSAKFEQ